MSKIFNDGNPVSRKQNDKLFKLFNSLKCNPDIVHDLTEQKSMPIFYKNILSLGLKFCFTEYPNIQLLRRYVKESVRKIAWSVYFKSQNEEKTHSNINQWYFKAKK